jgi:hypothetical protein
MDAAVMPQVQLHALAYNLANFMRTLLLPISMPIVVT